ncbi:MAG TPA: SDR family NAD(P)-dependent oxidoreductase [Gemmatimonadota bacterium]|nr:SDR family NAD(P)-dependent oxidoreductase [Gemmatimonadota bacterium]
MIDFHGKTVLVTGGSRGIGAACVRRFAELGARVGFTWRAGEAEAQDLERACDGLARGWRTDVTDEDQVVRFVREAEEAWGGVDVAIANAGIWKGARIDRMTAEEWDETLEVNLGGTWRLCREAVPALRRRGGGSIVVVSSTAGQRGESLHSHYAASKGAQISFVKSLAVECAPEIRVNAVAPGWVDTELSAGPLNGEERVAIVSAIPLGRVATAGDIADAIAFLASDRARHVTGEILNVNGGSVLCG